ncbi:MAG: HlyD family efflux transporter periplasmic adaptor subunit [Planctomycetes bacterium]|nr:HlyD family efflux transporter periplasmic adaptor subunit [Planctomycetota bacterium]
MSAALGLLSALSVAFTYASDGGHAAEARPPAGPSSTPGGPAPARVEVVAAPGVVEPATRLVELRVQQQGRLARVTREAGDPVAAGEVLAELESDVERARWPCARPSWRARAALARVEAGAREEVRAPRGPTWPAPRPRPERAASSRRARRRSSSAPCSRPIRSTRRARRAGRGGASRDAAAAWVDELARGERPEVIDEARAEVARAEAALLLAEAQLERTRVRSPLDGRVVYRHREPGEVVGIPNEGPPLLTVAGGPLRLRCDVDARDLALVSPGQAVEAVAPAFPGVVFRGRVLRQELTLGRKNFRTDRPRERIDTKVLEVLVELDAADLPLGLEMTATFLPGAAASRP